MQVFFARKYDIAPIGTIAHGTSPSLHVLLILLTCITEWIMGIAAMEGYEHCNIRAMKLWDAVRPPPSLPFYPLTPSLTELPIWSPFHRPDRHLYDGAILRRLCRQPCRVQELERTATRLGRPIQVSRDSERDFRARGS
jgi:hypothetical protein